MKVTVCELSNDPDVLLADWNALVSHVNSEASDLVLLPEMPFHPWVAQTNHDQNKSLFTISALAIVSII